MSHFNCSNCGNSMGIDWGYCDNCTPIEFIRWKKEREQMKQLFTQQIEKKYSPIIKEEVKNKMIEYFGSDKTILTKAEWEQLR